MHHQNIGDDKEKRNDHAETEISEPVTKKPKMECWSVLDEEEMSGSGNWLKFWNDQRTSSTTLWCERETRRR